MKYAFTLDLIDDPLLIAEYEKWHQQVWPEIKASIIDSDIESMQIYRYHNRLFMMMEVDANFTFEKKTKMDMENPRVQEWEALMWKYQQAIPGTKEGEKWQLMNELFSIDKIKNHE